MLEKNKEFKELFKMSLKGFEEYTGYSHNTLYNIFSEFAVVGPRARKAIADKLRERNEELKKQELIAVQKRCAARTNLIRIIETGEEE